MDFGNLGYNEFYVQELKRHWRNTQFKNFKGLLQPPIVQQDVLRSTRSFFPTNFREKESARTAEQLRIIAAQSSPIPHASKSPSVDALSGTSVKLCVKIPLLGGSQSQQNAR
jgi:hypothetical protein